jgi:hypothetical protein
MTVSVATLHKLRALKAMAYAKSCTDAERATAQKMLTRLLNKYDISEAEIDRSVVEWLPFSVKTEHELTLLGQLVAYVRQDSTEQFIFKRHKRCSGRVYVEVTADEHIEISRLLRIHTKALNKELEYSVQAYIQRNRLFGIGKSKGISEMTSKELNEIEAVLRRATIMPKTKVAENRASRLLACRS